MDGGLLSFGYLVWFDTEHVDSRFVRPGLLQKRGKWMFLSGMNRRV